MRLIDADATIYALNVASRGDSKDVIRNLVICFLLASPTVDAVPVRHGRWIVEYEVKDGRSMRCSECQMVFWVGSGRDGNYCPNCGARMDE